MKEESEIAGLKFNMGRPKGDDTGREDGGGFRMGNMCIAVTNLDSILQSRIITC